jgi:cytoskeleton protein RodZ
MAEDRKPGDVGARIRVAVDRKAGDFGSRLREARERKGISLREIANATKISIRALEALERNDISHLPGGIFSRAFVRSYAVEAGLNPEETVEDFVQNFPNDSVTAGHPTSTHIEDADSLESDRRMASVILRLVGISLPVAGIVLYFGVANRRDPVVTTPPAVAATAETRTSAAPPLERASHLTVEVTANRACAVSAAVDGQPPQDVQLELGGRRTFDAGSEMTLTVSDPAAVEWRINGVPSRALGSPSEAASVHLTLDNYKDFAAGR